MSSRGLWALSVPLALAGWFAWLGWLTGDPLAAISAQAYWEPVASGAQAVTTAPRRLEGVELESVGLAYAWSTTSGAKEAGRVAFAPMAALQGIVP